MGEGIEREKMRVRNMRDKGREGKKGGKKKRRRLQM